MPQSKERKAEYMRDYMAIKRGTNEGLTTEGTNNPEPVNPVSPRQALRDRLATLEREYRFAQSLAGDGDHPQDMRPEYRRINAEREPLFHELWELEKHLPADERYWFPSRIANQGLVLRHS